MSFVLIKSFLYIKTLSTDEDLKEKNETEMLVLYAMRWKCKRINVCYGPKSRFKVAVSFSHKESCTDTWL